MGQSSGIHQQKLTQKVKVAVFHLGFFYSGGGEKLVLEEIRGLKHLGYEIECFAPYVDRENCFPDVPEMSNIHPLLPAPPVWLPTRDPLWIVLSCLLVPLMAFRFRNFDVFFGANQPGCWFAFVLSKILRKPYVIYLAHPIRILYPRKIDIEDGIRIREGDHRFISLLSKLAGWFIRWADRASVSNAAIVLTNGEYVGDWIQRVYHRSNKVCPAGCQPAAEDSLDYSSRRGGRLFIQRIEVPKPYILLTNRHVPQKRFEYAIWALKQLQYKAPNLHLVITGQETEYTHSLRYLVDGLGLSEKVKFLGLVSERDLTRLYEQAVVYLYPSPEEDFGMGIVEAMAAGTPVVAWRNGGPTITVKDHETGFLIEPYDTDSFAEKIFVLVNDPFRCECMGRAGNLRAKDLFSYEYHNQIISDAFIEAICNHRYRDKVIQYPVFFRNES